MEWDYGRCASVLSQELGLLERISAAQDSVRKAALAREWIDFDGKLEEVNRLGEDFQGLEAERAALFDALAGGGAADAGRAGAAGGVNQAGAVDAAIPLGAGAPPVSAKTFYALTGRLPDDERRELADLYRALRLKSLRMRTVNESLLGYLHEAGGMAAACLDALFPDRGGGLYTRNGEGAPRRLTSMTLNCRA